MPEGDVFERWCGTVVIAIVLTANDEYTCTVVDGDDEVGLVIGPPAVLTTALDSDEAIDAVAHAAVSFATHEHPSTFSGAEMKEDASGWKIRREA